MGTVSLGGFILLLILAAIAATRWWLRRRRARRQATRQLGNSGSSGWNRRAALFTPPIRELDPEWGTSYPLSASYPPPLVCHPSSLDLNHHLWDASILPYPQTAPFIPVARDPITRIRAAETRIRTLPPEERRLEDVTERADERLSREDVRRLEAATPSSAARDTVREMRR